MDNRPVGLKDIFVTRSSYDVGGAKVVTDRNHYFVRKAADEHGRKCFIMCPMPRDGLKVGLVDRFIFLLFRLSWNELKPLIQSTLRGELGNVWLDHGALGLVAPVLRVLGFWARLHSKIQVRIHLFHHNEELRYMRDEYRESGASWSFSRWCRLGLIWLQQSIGMTCANRNYFISPLECRGRCAMVLPPSWSKKENSDRLERQDYVLLVGSRFFANEHGFQWYIDNVANHISAPSIIAGRGMDDIFSSAGKVTVLGFVSDLGELYDRARIVAVPIFRGAGTKVKLVEALNSGCQVIATKESCNGIADQEALITSGQLIPAEAANFAARLDAELSCRPTAPTFPRDRYSHANLWPLFLSHYES